MRRTPGITGRFGRMAARSTKYKYGNARGTPGITAAAAAPGAGCGYHGDAPGRPDLPRPPVRGLLYRLHQCKGFSTRGCMSLSIGFACRVYHGMPEFGGVNFRSSSAHVRSPLRCVVNI